MNIRDFVAAWWRKTVAVTVGGFLTWLARRWNIVLDAESAQTVVIASTVLVASVYGGIINFLETKVPALGWFLGLAQQPKYAKRPAETGDAVHR